MTDYKALADELAEAASTVRRRLQLNADDWTRPDEWSIKDMIVTLDIALAKYKQEIGNEN